MLPRLLIVLATGLTELRAARACADKAIEELLLVGVGGPELTTDGAVHLVAHDAASLKRIAAASGECDAELHRVADERGHLAVQRDPGAAHLNSLSCVGKPVKENLDSEVNADAATVMFRGMKVNDTEIRF